MDFSMMEVDEIKTADKARALLNNYFRIERIAGESYSPRLTASYSQVPKGYTGTVSNPTEKMVARKLDAQSELVAIHEAVSLLSDQAQILIKAKYMNRADFSTVAVYMDLAMSESSFYRKMRIALVEFAEAYKCGTLLVYK